MKGAEEASMRAIETVEAPVVVSSARVISVDVLRGFTIAFMILVITEISTRTGH